MHCSICTVKISANFSLSENLAFEPETSIFRKELLKMTKVFSEIKHEYVYCYAEYGYTFVAEL